MGALETSDSLSIDARHTCETILERIDWSSKLFSFRTTRYRGFRFAAGQFARLGLRAADDNLVWRAYSMVSAPYDDHLEFYSIVVPDGAFTTLLDRCRVGDEIYIEKASNGFLTIDRFVGGHDLWMLASGTGLAPFLSILQDPMTWSSFDNLVLVHSVREARELAYQETITGLPAHPLVGEYAHRLRYLSVVTRERHAGALSERITRLVEDGRLEDAAKCSLDPESARVMVCGNPQMVDDLRALLAGRGFRTSRRGIPGQMAFENYW